MRGNFNRIKDLHDSILSEVKDAKYDTFAKYDFRDAFVASCIQKQSNALSVTTKKLNPIAGKTNQGAQPIATSSYEHYVNKTSTYWRDWKRENDMLEALSEKKVRSPLKKSQRKSMRGSVKRDTKTCVLPAAENRVPSLPNSKGSTSVSDLMKVSMRGLPTISQLPYSDPDNIGASKSMSAGLMSSGAPSRPKVQPPVGNSEPAYDADRFLLLCSYLNFQIHSTYSICYLTDS
jgi:hypothetical protein